MKREKIEEKYKWRDSDLLRRAMNLLLSVTALK